MNGGNLCFVAVQNVCCVFHKSSIKKLCTVCFCFALSHDTMLLGAGNDESCGSLGDFVIGAVDWTVFEALEKGIKVGERVHCVLKLKSKEC